MWFGYNFFLKTTNNASLDLFTNRSGEINPHLLKTEINIEKDRGFVVIPTLKKHTKGLSSF